MHPYKISSHQLLSERSMGQRVKFCKTITGMFKDREPLHPQKVSASAAISIKGIYLQFFESTVTAETYKNLLETKLFPYAKKRGLVKNFHFMQDGAAPHRTQEVFAALHKVCDTRVMGLGYPKFARGGLEWPPYSPYLKPCDFFIWGYIKDHCHAESPETVDDLVRAIKKTVNGITSEIL